jgi:hypothetical protein
MAGAGVGEEGVEGPPGRALEEEDAEADGVRGVGRRPRCFASGRAAGGSPSRLVEPRGMGGWRESRGESAGEGAGATSALKDFLSVVEEDIGVGRARRRMRGGSRAGTVHAGNPAGVWRRAGRGAGKGWSSARTWG